MRSHWGLRGGNEQTACHAKVHNPLSFYGFRNREFVWAQVADNMLADTTDLLDQTTIKPGCLLDGRRFERLQMRSKPDFGDSIPAQALVYAASYGFDFG
jgi:hypothetical protein